MEQRLLLPCAGFGNREKTLELFNSRHR